MEDSELDLDTRPSTWQFNVDAIEEVVITVSDAEFETDRIYRPGHKSESASRFDDQTCSGLPVSLTALCNGFVGAVVIGVGALVLFLRRRRPVQARAE